MIGRPENEEKERTVRLAFESAIKTADDIPDWVKKLDLAMKSVLKESDFDMVLEYNA